MGGAQSGGAQFGGAPVQSGGVANGAGGMPAANGGAPAANGGNPAANGGANSGGAAASGGAASGGTSNGGTSNGGTPAGGVSAGGAAGSGGGSAGAKATGFLVEDFESGTVGKQPAGWDNFLSYVKNNTNPQSDGTLALIDATRAHSGKNSVHFHGGGNPAQLTRPLPSGTNKLYVRAWVYQTRQLGMNPGANHETLLGIRKASGSANDEVRFGEIKGVIGTNEVPSDNISPKMDQWGKGPVVAANQWACIEVAFIGDQSPNTLSAWAGGTLVHSITAVDQWQNGVMPATWLSGKFVEVMIGWQSFSSATNDVWMDDLVLSTSPIGCN
jgi:hypothetical protein